MPHLIPMDRGILATIYATPRVRDRRARSDGPLPRVLRGFPFVRVVDQLPATKDSTFTNFFDVTLRVVRGDLIVACLDNLIKSALGVAVQNFNLMFGYDETTGLM